MSDTSSTASPALPPCGLYRTRRPLPGREEQVGGDMLVYFHNHSAQGPPLVLLPAVNTHNTWSFHDRGYLASDEAWVRELEPLLAEGWYRLRQHVHAGDAALAPHSLVQLGYNRSGDPILFAARREANTLVFPERGLRFHNRSIFAQLEPAGFVVLEPPKSNPEEPRLLH